MTHRPTSSNCMIWDSIYSQKKGGLKIPDASFVSVFESEHNGAPAKVLDYGFGGAANMIHMLRRGCDVYGVEVSAACIDSAEETAKACGFAPHLQFYSGVALPYADASFDIVTAWLVLGYNTWDSLQSAVAEIDRVLMDGGLFIGTITAPDDITPETGVSLGDCTFQSKVSGQDGAIVLAPPKAELGRCFPSHALTVGDFQHGFGGWYGHHWIVTYRKNAPDKIQELAEHDSCGSFVQKNLYPDDNFVRLMCRNLHAKDFHRVLCYGMEMLPAALYLAGRGHEVSIADSPQGYANYDAAYETMARCGVSFLNMDDVLAGGESLAFDAVLAWRTLPGDGQEALVVAAELKKCLRPGGHFWAAVDDRAAEDVVGLMRPVFSGCDADVGSFAFRYKSCCQRYAVVRYVL